MTETRAPDELDALTRVCEMRAILAKAGRWDLADLAWAQLCPSGVPIRVRRDALIAAGYVAKDHPSMVAYRERSAADRGERGYWGPDYVGTGDANSRWRPGRSDA